MVRSSVELSLPAVIKPRGEQIQPLAGWLLRLGNIIPIGQLCSGMYRDGGSGGSGGDDDGSKGDGTGGGDECAGGAMLLTRRSPAEGGDMG
ncbi:hypothetical protein Tco_0936750 [Tanacetum coccineum]|uniref:Uncharacterized protein n=1 Tax=Tanacetum coccineum TaxID=301880 RepID=A0ABQ5DC91_9ASTR